MHIGFKLGSSGNVKPKSKPSFKDAVKSKLKPYQSGVLSVKSSRVRAGNYLEKKKQSPNPNQLKIILAQ